MKTVLNVIFCISLCLHLHAQNFFIEPKYPELLEPNSELIASGHNYTVEFINDNKYIFKTYWDDIPDIATYVTYDSDDFKTLHGPLIIYNEDGTVNSKGEYIAGKRDGSWQEADLKRGFYDNGKKIGEWKTYNDSGILIKVENYADGKLNGVATDYNINGMEINKVEYYVGEIISGTSLIGGEIIMPTYPGCEGESKEDSSYILCSKAIILKNFGTMRYPSKARNEGIQGKVYVRYTVDTDGSVKDIMPIAPANDLFIDEVVFNLQKMPLFIPGTKNGKAIKQWMTMPAIFKLEGVNR